MVKRIDWDAQLGRRLKLRDLHVFSTVVKCGSMAKAAQQLGVTHPTVSEVIGDLEHTFGVRLLDRSSQGIAPTIYGGALLKRSVAAFDELKQSWRDIAFLADPTVGEVRIGCPESLSAAILAPIIERFLESHPRVVLHVDDLPLASLQLSQLRERKHDLILARIAKPLVGAEDVNIDMLFNDRLMVATSLHSKWARRRTIELSELVNESWIITGPDTWNYAILIEAFQSQGLDTPYLPLLIILLVLLFPFYRMALTAIKPDEQLLDLERFKPLWIWNPYLQAHLQASVRDELSAVAVEYDAGRDLRDVYFHHC